MGDIKKIRKKYETPNHPWNKARIEQEKKYRKEFGLTNKKELWKVETILKKYKDQIKSFPSMPTEQAIEQEKKLRGRLERFGIIQADTPLGDVLGYDSDVVFNRRLQTIVYKKGLARTPKQARQMITHEHILINGKTINAPGYIVPVEEEKNITFKAKSAFSHDMHPERTTQKKETKKETKKTEDNEIQPELVELKPEDEDLE